VLTATMRCLDALNGVNGVIVVNDECPGCLDCGDDCDVWNGTHMWTKMYRNNDCTGAYSHCEFCGLKVEEEENGE